MTHRNYDARRRYTPNRTNDVSVYAEARELRTKVALLQAQVKELEATIVQLRAALVADTQPQTPRDE